MACPICGTLTADHRSPLCFLPGDTKLQNLAICWRRRPERVPSGPRTNPRRASGRGLTTTMGESRCHSNCRLRCRGSSFERYPRAERRPRACHCRPYAARGFDGAVAEGGTTLGGLLRRRAKAHPRATKEPRGRHLGDHPRGRSPHWAFDGISRSR